MELHQRPRAGRRFDPVCPDERAPGRDCESVGSGAGDDRRASRDDAVAVGRQAGERIVDRSVVDNDNLAIGVCLGERAFERFGQEPRRIVGGDDDADLCAFHQSLA